MSEIVAVSATEGDITYLTVDAMGSPAGKKDRDRCGVFQEYIGGAVCYRVCGDIPQNRKPKRVEFFTRVSYQGDHEQWVKCPDNGCEGVDPEFHQDISKMCGVFKLWKGDGGHRDLMMKVYLDG